MRPGYDTRYQTKVFIGNVARALIDEPKLISVNEAGGMHTSIMSPKVAKADIDKQGRTAGSLRIPLSAISAKK